MKKAGQIVAGISRWPGLSRSQLIKPGKKAQLKPG
jgi:hypothetical protein